MGTCVLVVFWPTVLPGYAALVMNEGPADAILDRLVHNAHRLELAGESMRKIDARRKKLDREPNP